MERPVRLCQTFLLADFFGAAAPPNVHGLSLSSILLYIYLGGIKSFFCLTVVKLGMQALMKGWMVSATSLWSQQLGTTTYKT